LAILIREHGGDWQEPVMGYENEKALQDIIHAHPSLVTGSLTRETETAVACREFQSGVGPADVIVLDAEGNLTLVECKLASNREVRREVIGQVLDYASRIWRMSADEFEQAWVKTGGRSPFEALDDADGRIRAAVQESLESARFKIVLAVDGINDDIRRIVEFLNRITVPETGVVVVEFMRARSGTTEVLIPTSFGTDFVEAKAAQGKVRDPREPWNGQDWYVNFGESPNGRSWEDAARYGFVSAGGSEWYSHTLRNLPIGARVFVYLPKYGYVGVGTVTGEAVPFRYAEVLLDGTSTRLADLPLQGTYGSPEDTTESAEYVVPVDWHSTTTRERAFWKKGMFANQNSACPLRNQFTIDQLAAFFGIEA